MTTSFEILIYSICLISLTSYLAFCSWNSVNTWSGNASFPFVGHLMYLWIVGCNYVHVQLWRHDCFLLKILRRKTWNLEIGMLRVSRRWARNLRCRNAGLEGGYKHQSISSSSFCLSFSESRNNLLGLGPYCWDSEMIRSTFYRSSFPSVSFIITKYWDLRDIIGTLYLVIKSDIKRICKPLSSLWNMLSVVLGSKYADADEY